MASLITLTTVLGAANFGYVPLGGKLVVNSLDDVDDGNINNGHLTLREAINFAKLVTWADTITFDPSLSGGVIHVGTIVSAAAITRSGQSSRSMRGRYQAVLRLTLAATQSACT